ncbi:MAG: hypothetical protein V1664_04995 [Candidatus Uhrbacteria bacterium]
MTKKFLKKIFIGCLLLAPLAASATTLTNPLGTTDLRVVAGNVIKAVLALSGSAAFLMFIYGGAQWILSEGKKEKIDKGQKTITWAILGLVFIFSAYAILYLVLSVLNTATA